MNGYQQLVVDEFDHFMSLATNYVSVANTTDEIREAEKLLYEAYGVLIKIRWYAVNDKAFKKEFKRHYNKLMGRYDATFDKAVERTRFKPEGV